jgi:ATP phosphoribosyltransferase regulatory subunit HisZ
MNTINLTLYNTLCKALSLSEEDSQKVAKAFQEAIAEKVAEKEATVKELINRETKDLATKTDLAETKSELLKWFTGGFITIVLVLLGLFATIILRK